MSKRAIVLAIEQAYGYVGPKLEASWYWERYEGVSRMRLP